MLAAAITGTGAAEPLPIDHIQLRGDRFPGLSYAEMAPEQRAMLSNVVNSARAVTNTTANGPFNVLLRSPAVGDLSQQLGNAIRFSSGLSARQRELATLVAGRAWTSKYEWFAHARYARAEGIAPAIIKALAEHEVPELGTMPADEAMVYRVADELLYSRRLSDATYAAALAELGERRLLSTVTIAAYYEYVSMILNVDRYPLPEDAPADDAAAARALLPLPPSALRREVHGSVSLRARIPNDDTERAIASLGERVDRDEELSAAARAAARSAVMRQWNGTALDARGNVAYRFAAELLDTRAVSDETFAETRAAYGERGMVNLLVLMGHGNISCAQQALAGAACVL